MAITIVSQPSAYMPCYNPHWWVATSSQLAQPNFKFYVTVTDLITSNSRNYPIDPDPSNQLKFNSATFAELYMGQVNPDGLYGFQKNNNSSTSAIRKIRVNIGEKYGTTPVVYPGSNVDYITWNGNLDFLDYPSYNYLNFQYNLAGARNFLTHELGRIETTFSGKSNYIYCIPPGNGDLASLLIKGYDANGNNIANNEIANPYSGGTTYTDKYVFIDVGYNGLQNMPAGQIITGPIPIPVSTYYSWKVYDYSDPGNLLLIKEIRVDCEPRYDVWTLHYLSKKGSFETINCSKLSEKNETKTVSDFKRLPWAVNGLGVYTYNRGDQVQKVLNVDTQASIKVNTDWITANESSYLKECFSSPLVYLNDGTGLVPVKITNSSYQEKKIFNGPLISVAFDLEFTHTNHRQRA